MKTEQKIYDVLKGISEADMTRAELTIWKMVTGSDASRRRSSRCEACGRVRKINGDGHCADCAKLAKKDHGGL